MNRTTLKDSVRFQGVGLFSAQPSAVILSPNTNSTGLNLRFDGTIIPVHIDSLSDIPVHPAFASMKPRCTSLQSTASQEHINIATVEHVLSALVGMGITDAMIDIHCDQLHCEIPILDGSSLDFARGIKDVGAVILPDTVEPITFTKTIRVEEGNSSITIEPISHNDTPSYTYALDYTNQSGQSPIASATVTWKNDPQDYLDRVAIARTFSLKSEADAMHNAGLFTHLTTKDMLVISDSGPIDTSFRHPDECALHKLLDLIGDLSLIGRPIHAKITAQRSGHALAHRAARLMVDG
jgi:UDP-3-O-acyl-N-acetylglucosamine deacetylase